MKNYLLTIAAILVPALCLADGGKFYTRKARLEDFTSKTTKVVLAGDALLQTALREEVSTRWYISPFEFCTPQDWESQKTKGTFYFIRPVVSDGIIFLTVTKGGKTDDADLLKRGFDIISFPIACADAPSTHELLYLGAAVDILQKFMEGAISSDTKAYSGLPQVNASAFAHRKTLLECAEADRNFAGSVPGFASGLLIAPAKVTEGAVCYKIVVTCDTHELCYFKKHQMGEKGGREFLKSDISKINALSAK